jgi:uncharacterized protein (TIGR02145 family)
MKKISLLLAVSISVLIIFCSNTSTKNLSENFNKNITVADSLKEQIIIGTQTWSRKNLDVITFRNGDTIPYAENNEQWKSYVQAHEPAWCYYEDTSKNKYYDGKLYNGYAVIDPRGLAPKGWHIPEEDDWYTLIEYLGGEEIAGAKMKSKERFNGTNSSGFSALPIGTRFGNGQYGPFQYAYWSVSKYGQSFEFGSPILIGFGLRDFNGSFTGDIYNLEEGLSIRLLKN